VLTHSSRQLWSWLIFNVGQKTMRFAITSVDMAEDFDGALPLTGKILRQLPGPDRSDYFLAALDAPFTWKKEKKVISHLVLCARWVGGVLSPSMSHTPVNIAYVTDESALSDEKLDFRKCYYAAIGVADGA
jgi:hypothetical protein